MSREERIEGEAMRTAAILRLLDDSIFDKMQDEDAEPMADWLFAMSEIIEDCGARLRRACGYDAEGKEVLS